MLVGEKAPKKPRVGSVDHRGVSKALRAASGRAADADNSELAATSVAVGANLETAEIGDTTTDDATTGASQAAADAGSSNSMDAPTFDDATVRNDAVYERGIFVCEVALDLRKYYAESWGLRDKVCWKSSCWLMNTSSKFGNTSAIEDGATRLDALDLRSRCERENHV